MSAQLRRRLDRVTALAPRCLGCEESDGHVTAAAARIQASLQRAVAESTPPELRRKAAELLAEAERLEREASE